MLSELGTASVLAVIVAGGQSPRCEKDWRRFVPAGGVARMIPNDRKKSRSIAGDSLVFKCIGNGSSCPTQDLRGRWDVILSMYAKLFATCGRKFRTTNY